MRLHDRLKKLETRQPQPSAKLFVLAGDNEASKIEGFKARNPHVTDFEIVRVELVPFSEELKSDNA